MHKKFSVGSFFDVEGAFSNVRSQAMIKAFEKFEVKSNLSVLFCDRTVIAVWGSAQWWDTFPIALGDNELLKELEERACRVTACVTRRCF